MMFTGLQEPAIGRTWAEPIRPSTSRQLLDAAEEVALGGRQPAPSSSQGLHAAQQRQAAQPTPTMQHSLQQPRDIQPGGAGGCGGAGGLLLMHHNQPCPQYIHAALVVSPPLHLYVLHVRTLAVLRGKLLGQTLQGGAYSFRMVRGLGRGHLVRGAQGMAGGFSGICHVTTGMVHKRGVPSHHPGTVDTPASGHCS